ncbi:MAG: mandelate racemase/muconate lactonizing enzyme family protein [Bryobacterales bacterium]|nr:mandelate racemase/muconate lactonizing enzyme family protein [Bryobacterales bacterium]
MNRRDFLKYSLPFAAGSAMAAGERVKVTRVELLRADMYNYVKVHTSGSVTGVGELHPASNTSGAVVTPAAALKYCEEYLIGKDPTEVERHWEHMFRRNIFRGGADSMAALGAVDMALWDITGKLAGLPIYKLLGGPHRETVRVYTHLGSLSPEGLAEEAKRRVDEGFTAVRFYPLGDRKVFANQSYQAIVRTAERNVAAVRKAVGPDIDVLIDVVCLLTPPEAIAVGRAISPYGLYFFEDPIEPDNIDALAHVAAGMPVPVSTGERLYTIYQFREVLNKNAAAYLRPDLSLAGGITNCRKIAALAEASYVGISPHNPLSCVLTAACVQVAASIHNLAIQEYPPNEFQKPKGDLVKQPLALERGYLKLPQTPGLGIELNEEAFKHYPPKPYTRAPVVSRDGALRDY